MCHKNALCVSIVLTICEKDIIVVDNAKKIVRIVLYKDI